jgi:hypothetical protein
MNEENIDLDATIKPLKATRRKLRNIDDETLDKMEPATQNEWADNLQKVSLAITRLETAKLRTLSDKFEKREAELREAAGQLKADLSELEDAVQIIRVASEVLKLIINIVRLLG